MNLTTEQHEDVAVVRVQEARMVYPILSDFVQPHDPEHGVGLRDRSLEAHPATLRRGGRFHDRHPPEDPEPAPGQDRAEHQ